MAGNKISIHRILKTTPEKVYKALTDADSLAAWIPPNGFTGKVHTMDFKVGGKYRMSFTNFTTGNSHSFGGEYLEIIPNELLVYTDEFEDPNMSGQIITRIELRKVVCGSELIVSQEGIPAVIPVEMCYLGWQESLEKLKCLVEPNISDA
jgi:uncharacterized protein YndB with AHSA1/START domain